MGKCFNKSSTRETSEWRVRAHKRAFSGVFTPGTELSGQRRSAVKTLTSKYTCCCAKPYQPADPPTIPVSTENVIALADGKVRPRQKNKKIKIQPPPPQKEKEKKKWGLGRERTEKKEEEEETSSIRKRFPSEKTFNSRAACCSTLVIVLWASPTDPSNVPVCLNTGGLNSHTSF